MRHDLHLHVIHVAGTRMIAQGTDGLSRGDLNTGVFGNKEMSVFVPLHLSAFERSPSLAPWLTREVYPDRALEILETEDWFDKILNQSVAHALWAPAPAAADVAVEQLCYARLKRPMSTHLMLIPRLMSCRWRRQLTKAADVILVLNTGSEHWGVEQHEPLLIAICLPMLRSSPWRLRGTPFVERFERSVRAVQEEGYWSIGPLLHEFLVQAWSLDTMPELLV